MNAISHSLFGCLLLITLPALQAHAESRDLDDTCALDPASDLNHEQKALRQCKSMAQGGNAQAAYELGEFFYSAETSWRNTPRALMWFEQASGSGHAGAQLRLGGMLFNGEGVVADPLQAYVVLKIGEINGSDAAMDKADRIAEHMQPEQLLRARQKLGRIFNDFMHSARTEPLQN